MIAPDTPANRALLRAIKAGSVQDVEQALGRGADPNVARGAGSQITCSALMRAVEANHPNGAAIVTILLKAGAPFWTPVHIQQGWGQGRTPLEYVMTYGHGDLLKAFVDHVGGEEAFLTKMMVHHRERVVLEKLLHAATHDGYSRSLFLKAMDRFSQSTWPLPSSTTGMPWPWRDLSGFNDPELTFVARLERRCPRPTPQSVGQEVWTKWMMENMHGGKGELFEQLCRATPVEWWLDEKPEEKKDPCGFRRSLLTMCVHRRCAHGLKIALKAIGIRPAQQEKLKQSIDHLLVVAASSGSPTIAKTLTKAVGIQTLEASLATQMALAVTRQYSENHSRSRLLTWVLDSSRDGVVFEAKDQRDYDDLTLLEQVLAWPADRRQPFIERWMAEGVDWNAPHRDGVTRLATLRRTDPEAAARWVESQLEERLTKTPARRAGVRL